MKIGIIPENLVERLALALKGTAQIAVKIIL